MATTEIYKIIRKYCIACQMFSGGCCWIVWIRLDGELKVVIIISHWQFIRVNTRDVANLT